MPAKRWSVGELQLFGKRHNAEIVRRFGGAFNLLAILLPPFGPMVPRVSWFTVGGRGENMSSY
jgi:hypothetical protein